MNCEGGHPANATYCESFKARLKLMENRSTKVNVETTVSRNQPGSLIPPKISDTEVYPQLRNRMNEIRSASTNSVTASGNILTLTKEIPNSTNKDSYSNITENNNLNDSINLNEEIKKLNKIVNIKKC